MQILSTVLDPDDFTISWTSASVAGSGVAYGPKVKTEQVQLSLTWTEY